MIIAEIVIVIGLYTFILLRMPELRVSGGIVAVALIGGLTYYLVSSDPEPQSALRRIDVVEVKLSDVDLQIGPRTSTLSGRVVNESTNFVMSGMILDVKIFDCPTAETALENCFTIGEDEGEARVSIPPGQLRDFKTNLLFSAMPEITGEMRWTHEITAVRALERPTN